MNVAAMLSERAQQTPNRAAIVDLNDRSPRTLTYAQLEAAAATAAASFTKTGLCAGDRVLVLHPMSASLYVALAGMLRAGLVPVVCDPATGRAQFGRACASVAPRAIFATLAGHAYALGIPACARIRRRFGPRAFPGIAGIDDARNTYPVTYRAPGDPALITFTSGSTATPKVIVRTHALLRAQLDAICASLPLDGTDVATMPIVLLANLAAGVTSVIPDVDLRRPATVDPAKLAAAVERTAATSITASPAMLEQLLSANSKQLRSLQRIVTGGGPVMPSLMQALARKIPYASIIAVYGSSEAEPIAHLDFRAIAADDFAAMRGGAGLLVGAPICTAAVRIIDGEIVVCGEHVVPGYLGGIGDEETKLRIEGNVWHRTGDGGYFDSRGRLWLTGRVQGVIRDGRGTLEPFRVECAISFDRAIARSALVAENGLRTVFLELREGGIDPSRVRDDLRWAQVDSVRRIARIPVDRRHNAKVDYVALRRMVRT